MNNRDGSIYLGVLVVILSCSLLVISTSFLLQKMNQTHFLYVKHAWEAYWLTKENIDLWKKGSTKEGGDNERFEIHVEDSNLTDRIASRKYRIVWRENEGSKEISLIGYKPVLPLLNVQ